MPAFESRRVRTHPLTVTGVSAGACPARICAQLRAVIGPPPEAGATRAAASHPATHAILQGDRYTMPCLQQRPHYGLPFQTSEGPHLARNRQLSRGRGRGSARYPVAEL